MQHQRATPCRKATHCLIKGPRHSHARLAVALRQQSRLVEVPEVPVAKELLVLLKERPPATRDTRAKALPKS